MKARPGPAYRPESFTRGYSHDQIVDHLSECLSIFADLSEDYEIPHAVAPAVFGVVQMMVAAVEPADAAARSRLALPNDGEASRLGIVGRG